MSKDSFSYAIDEICENKFYTGLSAIAVMYAELYLELGGDIYAQKADRIITYRGENIKRIKEYPESSDR